MGNNRGGCRLIISSPVLLIGRQSEPHLRLPDIRQLMDPTRKSRSFSEGHIDILRGTPKGTPRVLSNLQILLEDIGASPTTPPDPPSDLSTPTSPNELFISFLHRWSLRFSVHLSLVALFETLFFWLFVSKTEDAALIKLVNSYVGSLLSQCASLNGTQRALFMDVVDLFVNQTLVQSQGSAAAAGRAAFNGRLLLNSWLYVGSLVALASTLSFSAAYRRLPIQWRQLGLENLTLILILGIYEFMFFSTVVYPYESISMPELDRMLMNEIDASCVP